MADSTDGSNSSTQTAFAVIAGVAAFIVALVVLIFYFVRDRGMSKEIQLLQEHFDRFREEMQAEQTKRMYRYSKGTKEFLKQYKKPILQSAFDLQSRLTNQIKNNFLYSFLKERGGERDKNYALYNFSFVFAEFLGWLEVIRQELVFVTGDEDAPLLANLLEGIKFQLTGETPMQGTAPRGKEEDPEFEQHSKIFQLYAGELRSIGSVMIHADADGHKTIINADEFQRLMTVQAPPENSSEQAKIDWHRSRERLFQDMMLPLFDHLKTMAQLPKGQAPIRRLAIVQVLLCKLIDLLDNAVPWDSGPKYDPGEEPQYIARDFRLTPLVNYLNSYQRDWLSKQLFMENAEKCIADPGWDEHMNKYDAVWRKLCFCGFREDLAGLKQEDREKKPDMWPGCCPPKQARLRPEGFQDMRTARAERNKSLFMRSATATQAIANKMPGLSTSRSQTVPAAVAAAAVTLPAAAAAAPAAAASPAVKPAGASQDGRAPASPGRHKAITINASASATTSDSGAAASGSAHLAAAPAAPAADAAAQVRAAPHTAGPSPSLKRAAAAGSAAATAAVAATAAQAATAKPAADPERTAEAPASAAAAAASVPAPQPPATAVAPAEGAATAPAVMAPRSLPPTPGHGLTPKTPGGGKPHTLPPLGSFKLHSNRVEPEPLALVGVERSSRPRSERSSSDLLGSSVSSTVLPGEVQPAGSGSNSSVNAAEGRFGSAGASNGRDAEPAEQGARPPSGSGPSTGS